MKQFFVVLLLAFVSWTFVQFVNSFPTFDKTEKSQLSTNSSGILRKRHPRATAVEYLWPNGEILYKFNYAILPEEKCLIERAMYHIMWNSCIRFRMKSENDTHWFNFVNDTDCSIVSRINIVKTGLSKSEVEVLNEFYKCTNPLRPSYEFIRQFVEHYHRCVGKIYNDINRNNALNKVTLKSNKKRSISFKETNETTYDSTIIQGDILIRANKSPFSDGNVQSSAINPAITEPFSNITTWTNGIIPYDLDTSLETHKCLIENAMLQIMLNTCIRFRPRNDRDTFYLRIIQDPRHSCYGYIGMDLHNHATKVSLPDGCLDIGTVVHELMHAIGFYHHQNRQDRDQHLKIHDENIQPNMSRNFRLNDPLVEQILTPWDYDSVMLYGAKFFSKDNRSITMEPTVPGVVLKNVYDKPGLSKFDAIAINQLYKCPNVSNSNFYYDLSLMKPMLKLAKSCNSSNPENVKSYQYIFK